ncbi:hypothetical protein [Phenylobacterium sp.]|uniref:hypothetical protein n=1 Tax=Phenylobacterium sp. TaxID=1871053 RepID=UPI002B73E3ED|nr:hypothetical protein [Phenylobacterium sp.]HLZ77170.1 hypothetical protein [Phenylobacterium sp.]
MLAGSISVVLHLLAAVALLGTASGQLLADEGAPAAAGGLPPMAVSVVSASSLRAPSTTRDGLRPLFAKYGADQPPVQIADDPHRSAMSRLLGQLQGAEAGQSATSSTAGAGKAPSIAPVENRSASARGRGHGSDAGAPGSTGGLWGAVEPCWTRLAGASSVPVTLEVTLDARGRLSTPPRILREAGPANEARLRAEANALAALAACLPEGDVRFSGRLYRLEFQSPQNAAG